MKRQCKYFILEIETLKEELKEVKEKKAENKQQAWRKEERSLVKVSIPSKEEEIIQSQGLGSKSPIPT